jgi:SPP1 gp7 family putative phage head morphogenesis protein
MATGLRQTSRPIRRTPPPTLAPVHPNQGVAVAFRRRLWALIEEMHESLLTALTAEYRAANPQLAQDAPDSVHRLRWEMDRLGKRWLDRFETAAPELAAYFATAAKDRVDGALAASLRKSGISVRFQITPAIQEALDASMAENVSLIRSIAQQHLGQVEQLVMRSVTAGRNVGGLRRDLQNQLGVTKRRAALIARNQNNVATATVCKTRQQELGITKAIWVHSSAGRHPRPEHVAFNGKEYEVAKGAWLEGRWTWPGREINCRCVSRSIIPGLARPTSV